ncbi:MAG TPA: cation:proton antiporter [Hyphomicrobiaceae bacterium]|nr:cation:proton antiporter [Hyphomicrobiaceae bacterium]
MDDQMPILLAIAILALTAVASGLVLTALRQPPLVGYILAGVVLGPSVFGFLPQIEEVPLIAHFGVLFLLFVIGMEVSLRSFIADLKPALVLTLATLAIAFAAMMGFGAVLGWKVEQALLLAFVVSTSSTAVVLKVLEDIGQSRSHLGRIVIATTIAQDIAIVPMLIVANAFRADGSLEASTLVTVAIAIGGLAVMIAVLGPRGKIAFPFQERILGRVEIVTLVALLLCCAAAVLSGIAGMSAAYGAFLAGLFMGRTTLRTEAITAMQPIQSVLMVMFFVTIGLMLDVGFIVANAPLVAVFVLAALIGKSAINVIVLRLVGLPSTTAFQAGLILGQIGEFAFVLAAVGLANQVLDPVGYKLAISVIVLSLLFSPMWTYTVQRVQERTQGGMKGLRMALFRSTPTDEPPTPAVAQVYSNDVDGEGKHASAEPGPHASA